MPINFFGEKSIKVGIGILLGLVSTLWFIYFYPTQHPYSLLNPSIDKKEAGSRGIEELNSFGFRSQQYRVQPQLRQNASLIQDLQRSLGRSKMMEHYRKPRDNRQLLPIFHWQINLLDRDVKTEQSIVLGESDESDAGRDEDLHFKFTQNGNLSGFQNRENVLPEHPVDRRILQDANILPENADVESIPDSLLIQRLRFDLTGTGQSSGRSSNRNSFRLPRSNDMDKQPIPLDSADARKIAQAQLKRFIWDQSDFHLDTLYTQTLGALNGARVVLQRNEPFMGQQVSLEVDITSTGLLMGLHPDFELFEGEDSDPGDSNFWEVLRLGFLILVIVFLLVLFYRRLKVRVVDTKSALVLAIGGGLLLPLQAGLFMTGEVDLDSVSSIWEYLMIFGMMVGLTGTLSTLAFFVLTGVGESITRQAWPEKLEVYNLFRQGLFLNKPVGLTLIRSVLFAAILTAVWTLFLQLSPSAGINIGNGTSGPIFYTDFVPLPSLYIIAEMGWVSLSTLLIVHTTLGSSVYNFSNRKWLAWLTMAVSVALLPLLPLDLVPPYMDVIATLVIGGALALCFLYYEAVTTLLTLFLFLFILQIHTAWLPGISPDYMLLYTLAGFILIFAGIGVWAAVRGRSDQQLPDYVPDYVEELAREQRMKQELKIAQRVQQDFLPLKTPDFSGWDMSAVCKPAFETGGDYYDFIPIDDHRIAIAIGDVSGKGIEAAFYMTFVKGVLHSLSHETDSPSRLLQKANRLFYQNAPRGTFISLIYGIVDLQQQRLRFARAGHNPVLFKAFDEDIQMLKPSGLGLGLNEGEKFNESIEEQELFFDSGDILILYTDGMVEAVSPGGEFFGYDRFLHTFQNASDAAAKEIIDNTVQNLDHFIADAEQHDDMTMIVIKKR